MVIERTIYSDKVMNALVAAGCTVEGASGAAGNLFAESKMNPRIWKISAKRSWDISIPMTPTRKQ